VENQQSIARHLRSLPQEIRQPYDWTEFRRRARERTSADTRRGAVEARRIAIAAALILVLVGAAAWLRMAPSDTALSAANPSSNSASETSDLATVSELDLRADIAERWLASLPREPVVVQVGTRAAVEGLEDRIAQLDDVLSAARVEGAQPAKLAPLEEQRARLVKSLVQVRYAETLVAQSR
jgi:hypothetical protein